jgi:hypothetical protein
LRHDRLVTSDDPSNDLAAQLLHAQHRLRALESAQPRRNGHLVIGGLLLLGLGAAAGVLAARPFAVDDPSTPIEDPAGADEAWMRAHADVVLLVAMAHAGMLTTRRTLGRVAEIEGAAPAVVGESCSLFVGSSEGCGATIRCGDSIVHSLACRDAEPVDVFRHGDGVDVWHRSAGWTVRIRGPGDPTDAAPWL